MERSLTSEATQTIDVGESPWYARLVVLVEDLRRREDRLALALSLLIGALVGLVVVAFILLTGRLAAHMYPPGGAAAWRRVAVPVLGALVTGWLLYRFFPDARGSGIPQTRAAIFINDGRISLRTVLGKFLCCSTSLASGIALGREGPSVHIGSGIASVIGRRLGFSTQQIKWLIPVGASAALAAAFNTPIAAVLFSLEEITGDLHAPILGSVVLSSTTSWMVLHMVLGDEPLFHVAAYHLVGPSELIVYAALGIIGGLGSVAFVRLLLALRKAFARLPKSTVWLQPVAGGLCVGLFGFFVPQVLGVGYDQVDHALSGDLLLRALVLFGVLKILATAMCYASGNAGGIFGPSMFIGAMIGGAVGQVAHQLLPATTAGPGAYALVGMGTAFAGIIRTPLTSVIMIFEVTRNYTIIVPLMISNLLAFYISQKFQREPIYEALARQDGLHLPSGEFRTVSRRLRVSAAARPAPVPLTPELTLHDAMRRVEGSPLGSWPVSNDGGLLGMVRVSDIAAAVSEGRGSSPLETLREASGGGKAETDLPHVHGDHPLALALSRMGSTRHTVLPVVSRANVRSLLGVVTIDDVLQAYGLEHSPETLPPSVARAKHV
ncbi:MAG TPA: chloride channel protein [Gemmatimonadaceae bacterium]|jgi:CIC family chloride channel protein|nr:chloride channel protein [Gemmatimonadaceae bacterium]